MENNKKTITVLSIVEHIKPKFSFKKERLSNHDLPISFVSSAIQILTQETKELQCDTLLLSF